MKKDKLKNLRDKTVCPFGHDTIDYVNLGHREYIFCYTCGKKFFEEDYEKINNVR